MRFWKQLAAVFLFASGLAGQAQPAPAKSAFAKATFEEYVRHLFVWGPQIQVKIGDPKPSELPGFVEVTAYASAGKAQTEQRFYVSKDGRKIVQGAVYDISRNPFQKQIDRIKTDSLPVLGDPNAPVVIVEISDFQCPFCKEEAKMLRENVTKTYPTQVRLHFKDLPLEAIHPWAKQAAVAGRCFLKQKPDLFWQYHDWIFENQAQITPENIKAKLLEFARGASADVLQLNRCLDSPETAAEVDRSIAEALQLGVNSTPTLLVNGRMLSGRLSWPQLKGIIDFELEYQKKIAANTGCEVDAAAGCEVKLPTPFAN